MFNIKSPDQNAEQLAVEVHLNAQHKYRLLGVLWDEIRFHLKCLADKEKRKSWWFSARVINESLNFYSFTIESTKAAAYDALHKEHGGVEEALKKYILQLDLSNSDLNKFAGNDESLKTLSSEVSAILNGAKNNNNIAAVIEGSEISSNLVLKTRCNDLKNSFELQDNNDLSTVNLNDTLQLDPIGIQSKIVIVINFLYSIGNNDGSSRKSADKIDILDLRKIVKRNASWSFWPPSESQTVNRLLDLAEKATNPLLKLSEQDIVDAFRRIDRLSKLSKFTTKQKDEIIAMKQPLNYWRMEQYKLKTMNETFSSTQHDNFQERLADDEAESSNNMPENQLNIDIKQAADYEESALDDGLYKERHSESKKSLGSVEKTLMQVKPQNKDENLKFQKDETSLEDINDKNKSAKELNDLCVQVIENHLKYIFKGNELLDCVTVHKDMRNKLNTETDLQKRVAGAELKRSGTPNIAVILHNILSSCLEHNVISNSPANLKILSDLNAKIQAHQDISEPIDLNFLFRAKVSDRYKRLLNVVEQLFPEKIIHPSVNRFSLTGADSSAMYAGSKEQSSSKGKAGYTSVPQNDRDYKL